MVDRVRTRQEAAAPTTTRIRHAVPATKTVDVEVKQNNQVVAEKHEIEQVTVLVAETLNDGAHGTVHVGGSVTKQPQPYHSISVRVGLTMPCNPTYESADRVYASASKWVDAKITREMALANGEDV